MLISQSAFDLIVREEVSSQAYYTRHYQNPEWPGGASGITIGIGYDLGYASRDKINLDWSAHVGYAMLQVMLSCSGIKGDDARRMLASVKSKITIPWDAAIDVFANRDVPQWVAVVRKVVPNTAYVSQTCLGVLTSLAYNRGAAGFASSSDRCREMNSIRLFMGNKMFPPVSGELRAMKRLWPTVRGLQDRRDHEAALWDQGLSEPVSMPVVVVEPDPSIPTEAGAARTKPPATTGAQHGTTGAVIVATGAAAQQAHAHGMISLETAIFLGFLGVLAGITAWVVWYRNRNPK